MEIEFEVEACDKPFDAPVPFGPGDACDAQRIVDVVECALPGKQCLAIVLEYVADARFGNSLAVEQNLAGIVGREAAIMLMSVDLPQPFGPKTDTIRPVTMSRSKPSYTGTAPNVLRSADGNGGGRARAVCPAPEAPGRGSRGEILRLQNEGLVMSKSCFRTPSARKHVDESLVGGKVDVVR